MALPLRNERKRAMSGRDNHRQVKYLNNVIGADHGKLKRLIKLTFIKFALGFKTMKTAYAIAKSINIDQLI